MTRFLLSFLVVMGALMVPSRTHAFTLAGEIPPWFDDNRGLSPFDLYGPMNLGEEYRWTIPTIHYGFDESFLNYFGQRGVEEVEKAIQILNALPAMSTVNLASYPLHSQRVNYRARDLTMLDVKSEVLSVLMEEMGLMYPGRFVFTLRNRWTVDQATNYYVMQRNFDPETWEPTPYINGNLWTYLSIYDNQDAELKAAPLNRPVDPLILGEPVASTVKALAHSVFGYGSFYTGLTRDDVGGLRYIYRRDNLNVETLPADATGSAGLSFGGGTGGWIGIPGIIVTNAPGDPTDPDTGVPAPGGNAFLEAYRGGIDKLNFVRVPNVIFSGGYALTNRYSESIQIITNGTIRRVNQTITRAITVPDILFTAEDRLEEGAPPINNILWRTEAANSNDAINGQAELFGPGQIGPGGGGPVVISLNKVGQLFFNSQPSFLSEPGLPLFLWGSYDGSTNEPTVYPSGTSIRAIEAQVFGTR